MHNHTDIPNTIQSEIYPNEKILWQYKTTWYSENKSIFFMILIITTTTTLRIALNDYFIPAPFSLILFPIIIILMYKLYVEKVYYILTDKRAITINSVSKQAISLKNESNITIMKHKNNNGTIIFGSSIFSLCYFHSIPDINHIEKLVYNIQNGHYN